MRHGFTLIELVIALAITALVCLGALSATAALARSGDALQRRSRTADFREALGPLLRHDLQHARRLAAAGDGIELNVSSALDPASLTVDHVPATVRYEIRHHGQSTWLVRRQTSPLVPDSTALVCPGVNSLTMQLIGRDGQATAAGRPQHAARVRVRLDRADTPLHDEEAIEFELALP